MVGTGAKTVSAGGDVVCARLRGKNIRAAVESCAAVIVRCARQQFPVEVNAAQIRVVQGALIRGRGIDKLTEKFTVLAKVRVRA